MKSKRVSLFALVIGMALVLTSNPASLRAQDVKVEPVKIEPVTLEGPTIQELLDQLFGTDAEDGLLDGSSQFKFRAEDVVLTKEEAELFFAPSDTNEADFADLVAAAKLIKGTNMRIEGTLDGDPFEFQMSGKQLKAEGLVLTQEQFDALVDQLKSVSGLHSAKIEATVDGELLVAKLQNVPGKVKIEHHGFVEEGPTPTPLPGTVRALRPENSGRSGKVEKMERPVKVERLERPEKIQRVERPVKIERIEKPEVSRGGKGRG
jgi:hypothetical protein